MNYVDSLMAANERIVYRTKKHWIAPLLASATGSLLVLGGLAALLAKLLTTTAWLDFVLLWVGLAILLIGLVLLGRSIVMWWAQDYFVTNQKVMKVEGIVRKKVGGAGLEKINDITMEQDVLGRWLDYGTLSVMTAADESNLNYWAMRKPAEFRRAILDQKQLLEQADSRFIADAVREAAGPAAGPVAPLPASGAAEDLPETPGHGASPVDIPVLIERLAALHAKGALTDEEFSSKKTELLKRL
ncbi:MAG: PH domain-containing protein [Candidatus Nanopelagicales bacterium]